MCSVGPRACRDDRGKGKCCHGGRMERFVQPCILLLLREKPSHGYDLMSSLSEFGFGSAADPGLVYRNLRKMEEDGLVRSSWDTGGPGPAKRLYEVTDEGEDFIHGWAATIRQNVATLQLFLERYDKEFGKQKEDF